MRKLIVLLLFLLISYFVDIPSSPDSIKPTATPTPSPAPAVLGEKVTTSVTRVTHVIDGDTVEINGEHTVRYIGIDTPETKKPGAPVQCFGREAYEKNKELVEGREVILEKDVSETDRYGRLLRYVYLPKDEQLATGEAIFVNDYLVRQGYAQSSTYPPDVKYQKELTTAQEEAQLQLRGLWKECL